MPTKMNGVHKIIQFHTLEFEKHARLRLSEYLFTLTIKKGNSCLFET